MSPFVHLFVVGNVCDTICFRWDDGLRALVTQYLPQMVCIKSLVAPKRSKLQSFNQIGHANNLASLSGKQGETDQIAQGIDQSEYFGGQAAFGPPDGVILSPPFAPLAFW